MALECRVKLKSDGGLAIKLNLAVLPAGAIVQRLHAAFLKGALQAAPGAAVANTERPDDFLAEKGAEDRFNIASALGRDPATAVSPAGAHLKIGIRDNIRGKFIHMARSGENRVKPQRGLRRFLGNGSRFHSKLLRTPNKTPASAGAGRTAGFPTGRAGQTGAGFC